MFGMTTQTRLNTPPSVEPAVDPGENSVAFYALIIFTLILYIAPQNYILALQPFRLGLVSACAGLLAYLFNTLRKKNQPIHKDTEIRLVALIVFCALLSIPFSKWPGGSAAFLINSYLKVIIIFFLINFRTRIKRIFLIL